MTPQERITHEIACLERIARGPAYGGMLDDLHALAVLLMLHWQLYLEGRVPAITPLQEEP
jgi:hypothetical protein